MCYRLPCQLYCVIIKLMENLHTEIGKNGFLNIQVTEERQNLFSIAFEKSSETPLNMETHLMCGCVGSIGRVEVKHKLQLLILDVVFTRALFEIDTIVLKPIKRLTSWR